jgi:hypothetical protein
LASVVVAAHGGYTYLMKVPVADWRLTGLALVVCGVISVTVARSVTEKRLDAVLKQQQLSMEREARIWLEWMEAVERGEPAALSFLHSTGNLVLMSYSRQAEANSWMRNPILQDRIRKHREYLKANPGQVGRGLQKLGSGPWLPLPEDARNAP